MGPAEEALRGIAVRPAGELADPRLAAPGGWRRVCEELHGQGLGVLPRTDPAGPHEPVLVFPLGGAIGSLLQAGAVLLETGGRPAAEELADACRSLAALTSIPSQRLQRAHAVAAGPSARARLDRQVAERGNGYLPMPAAEAVDALKSGGRQRQLRSRDGVFPLPRPGRAEGGWVVVRHSGIGAVGLLLTGVEEFYNGRDAVSSEMLRQALATAAAALQPGPAALEWLHSKDS
ncbi:hypothetical protein ACFVYG_32550 [Streptomyces sp. NPDC058256]|uniref:hypothetical protein n=1 Tax=Streptomyces sp. NPDC058256 TaxID=3346408 RepID=UPI0036E04867